MAQKQSLRNLHYALLKSDTAAGVEYEKPEPLVGAISAKINPSSSQELELATLPLKAQAALLGHHYEDGVMTLTDSDDPPFLAIGFMSQPSPGKYRLVWLYKGKFQLIADEYATATDAAAWRLPKLTGSFVKREHDGQWQIVADSSDPGFTAVDLWFKSVYPSTPSTEPEETP